MFNLSGLLLGESRDLIESDEAFVDSISGEKKTFLKA